MVRTACTDYVINRVWGGTRKVLVLQTAPNLTIEIMTDDNFKIKTIGFGELAQLSCPDVHPNSARFMLRRWINRHPLLQSELRDSGYKKGQRILLPLQVGIIIKYLGEP